MANGTVEIKFKLDGTEQFHTLELDVKSAGEALKGIQENARNLNTELVNLASKTQLLESLSSVVQQLTGAFQDLSASYAVQEAAEARLAQAMRNTMGATNDEIESIKQLCTEQQKLGVIGDEVQIAASQELATYLSMSSNLKTLIPVMNDMVAQQYGLGASAESATQIASMLGKVMNGQTEALSRYGYKFDEVQKHILQYGDESERAAVLAQVVSEAVGGMNERLAQTPTGQMAQLRNTLGDIKEFAGRLTASLLPVMTVMTGFVNTWAGFQRIKVAIDALSNSAVILKVRSLGIAAAEKIRALAHNLASAATKGATVSVKALTIATAALYTVLTAGIAAAIMGLVALFNRLSNSTKEAKEGLNEVDDATKAYNDAVVQARTAIAKEIVELEKLIKSHGSETQKVQELNDKYGENFGYRNTAKEWYDTLIEKSRDYCRQLGYEAKAQAISKQMAENEVELREAQKRIKKAEAEGNTSKVDYKEVLDYSLRSIPFVGPAVASVAQQKQITLKPTQYAKDKARVTELESENGRLEQELRESIEERDKAAASLNSGKENAETDWRKMSYNALEKAIQTKKTAVGNLAGVSGKEDEWKRESNELKQMEARKKQLAKESGLSDSSSNADKDKYSGKNLIEGAKNYKELSNNVKYYEKALEKADATDKEQFANLVKGYTEAKDKLDTYNKAKEAALLAATPDDIKNLKEVTSLEQVNKAIEYQQKLRSGASAEQLKNIDAEIKRLEALKTAFEDSVHIELKAEEIKSYEQLEDEIAYYNKIIKKASAEEREEIQQKITALEKLQKKWDEAIEKLSKPGDISTLNTIEELDEAINWYGRQVNKVGGDEQQEIQKTIVALQKKKAAQESLLSIPTMQSEIGELNGLEGKSLRMKLELIGLDGVMQKIREIREMLSNPANDLTEEQRKSLIGLEKQYNKYLKTLIKSDKSLISGWGTVRGISGSIESMTDALKGQGSAWKKISAIVDGAISIYQSIGPIIELIKMLTGVTKAQTVAKQIEGQANLQAGTEALTGAAMEVGASKAVQTEKAAETTANVGAAASGLMSAHSSIPFVGFAIGAAMVVAMLALMASLPKFADGGIAYGPTLGLFGEYAGASRNPEVVAPLDRLKGLLQDSAGFGSGRVTFRIEGRTLVGVLDKESHYRQRT